MSRVSDTDGLHLYGWMRNVLHLAGGELITFAIVFRSSQSNTGIYIGGIPYVADFIGCTKETARKYLHSLEQKGLIEGKDVDVNGVHYRNYQIIDNQIPKKFGHTPKNFGGDTQKNSQGIPKNFGLEEYNKEEYNKNTTTGEGANSAPHTPTLNEVADYAKTQGFADPAGFADYYIRYQTENGWMTGKGKNRKPIDNWKLNVLAWRKNHKDEIFSKPNDTTTTRVMTSDEFKQMFK